MNLSRQLGRVSVDWQYKETMSSRDDCMSVWRESSRSLNVLADKEELSLKAKGQVLI